MPCRWWLKPNVGVVGEGVLAKGEVAREGPGLDDEAAPAGRNEGDGPRREEVRIMTDVSSNAGRWTRTGLVNVLRFDIL